MYRKQFIDTYLKNNFGFEEAKSEIDFALDILYNYKYQDFILGKVLEPEQIEKLKRIVEERTSTHRPLQQILGQSFFYGRKFFVNNSTLIPRPETELLVKEALDIIKDIPACKILDIGTGTGCIPITIALENQKSVIDAVDISQSALETAQKNKLYHNVFSQINFIKSDLFENVNKKYNVIISNPPYIPLKDKDKLDIEVKNFDPPEALFAPDEDGVLFYKKIADKAKDYLYPNGFVIFELGINQSNIVKDYVQNLGYKNIRILKDFNSIERIIIFTN